MTTLANRIQEIADENGWSLRELARRAALKNETDVQLMMAGKEDRQSGAKIAKAAGVEVLWLLSGEVPKRAAKIGGVTNFRPNTLTVFSVATRKVVMLTTTSRTSCFAPAFPKSCACGRSHSKSEWPRLPLVGVQRDVDDVPRLELRNCTCESTIAVEICHDGTPYLAIGTVPVPGNVEGVTLAKLYALVDTDVDDPLFDAAVRALAGVRS